MFKCFLKYWFIKGYLNGLCCEKQPLRVNLNCNITIHLSLSKNDNCLSFCLSFIIYERKIKMYLKHLKFESWSSMLENNANMETFITQRVKRSNLKLNLQFFL